MQIQKKSNVFFPVLIHSDIRATIDILTAIQVSFFLLLRNRENPLSILRLQLQEYTCIVFFVFNFFLAVESFKPKVDTSYFTCV